MKSLTSIDKTYFSLIESENQWTHVDAEASADAFKEGAPDSNALTETDREYFNIVKTEDGLSKFFKNYFKNSRISQFQFHQVNRQDEKPIVGLFLRGTST